MKSRTAPYLAKLAFFAFVGGILAVAQVSAEQATSLQTTAGAQGKRPQAGHILAPVKPGTARSSTAKNARAEAPHHWSIKDALPEHSSAISTRDSDTATKSTFGRIPLQSGTLGFETETKIKSTEYPDGQRMPGVDTNAHTPPSYLGFSFSMPTGN